MKKYTITAESSCDLSAGTIEERGFKIIPFTVILGTREGKDGVVTTDDLFGYVQKTGELPKTAAISVEEYREFFNEVKKDSEAVIHFAISSKASSTCANAVSAAEGMENVYVVDTKSLSTGEAILMLKADDMLKAGKDIKEVYEEIVKLTDRVQISFVIDTLDYLHKGGRCSSAALVGSKILKVHPYVFENGGELMVKKKYMGSLQRSLMQYVADIFDEYKSFDKTRAFVTHSPFEDRGLVDAFIQKTKELSHFDEYIETDAGATISTHCGKNTIGIVFIKD